MFAKLFETEVGQILVKVDTGEDAMPEVRIYFEPEGLGVCSTAFTWTNESESKQWNNADSAFEELTEEKCVSIVGNVLDNLLT